ncbi:MAG: hypothetical protein ACK5QT_09410 [Oligoflexia bacterium]
MQNHSWALLEESLRRLRLDLVQSRDVQSSLKALDVTERALLLFPAEKRIHEAMSFFDLPSDSRQPVQSRVEVPQDLELPKVWESLLKEFMVECIRNWCAHAMESRNDRKFYNKPDIHAVVCKAWLTQASVMVSFEDDGPGLRSERVLARAEKLGLLSPVQKQQCEKEFQEGNVASVYQLLFCDGFSTTEISNEDSGRGMGLSRLAGEAKRLGAKLSAEKSSRLGGLCFRLELPCRVIAARVWPAKVANPFSAPFSVQGSNQILSKQPMFTCQKPADSGLPSESSGEHKVFSLLPAESAAWAREQFGGIAVSWICHVAGLDQSASGLSAGGLLPFFGESGSGGVRS